MSRGPLDHSVTLLMSADEHDFFDYIKGALGIGNDSNLLRLAVSRLADATQIPMGRDMFAPRSHADAGATRSRKRPMTRARREELSA